MYLCTVCLILTVCVGTKYRSVVRPFSEDEIRLLQKRHEEGYDIMDDRYSAWLNATERIYLSSRRLSFPV